MKHIKRSKTIAFTLAFGVALASSLNAKLTNTDDEPANQESHKCCQSQSNFENLFPTDDFSKWQSVNGGEVPNGWTIQDGIVHLSKKGSNDIITQESYQNFELVFEWKISEAGNSGIKYRTHGKLGLEYQILDDQKHKDREKPSHRSASLYDLKAAPDDKPIKAVGQWNSSRVKVNGDHIEHWLNDELVIKIEYGSDDWNQRFSNSKYREHENFGNWTGPILLQDHNDPVWYRNIKIRKL